MIQGVQLIILNKENKVLIAKRAPFKKNGDPRIGANRWNLIGGKIDLGEIPIETARRECYEESGLDIAFTFISAKVNPWDLNYDPFYASLFLGYIDNNQKVILNPEHTEFKFIEIHEICNYDFLGYETIELQKALEQFKEGEELCPKG